jgi:hypothetical protein
MRPIDRLFLIYASAVGLAVGIAVTLWPALREFRISPYFWVLIAVALYDVGAVLYGRGAPDTTLAMQFRLLGFVTAIVLMVLAPIVAGPLLRPA